MAKPAARRNPTARTLRLILICNRGERPSILPFSAADSLVPMAADVSRRPVEVNKAGRTHEAGERRDVCRHDGRLSSRPLTELPVRSNIDWPMQCRLAY